MYFQINPNAPSTINAGTLHFNIFLCGFLWSERFKFVCSLETAAEGAAADICLQQFDFIKLTVRDVQFPGFSFKKNYIERLLQSGQIKKTQLQ